MRGTPFTRQSIAVRPTVAGKVTMRAGITTTLARPKVNLTLKILGRRDDGYHALESLVAFADAPADIISLDTDRPRGVSVSGPFAGGIAGINLLETVFDLVANAAPDVRLGHVALEKLLPVAAGVGGGSADAAALLRLLRCANPDHNTSIDWFGIARRLGADVPVCLFDRTAWMTGIGEQLQAVDGLPRLSAVLVNPQVAVPADKTAQVFRALGAPALGDRTYISTPPCELDAGRLFQLIEGGNNLEAAARTVVPAIKDVLRGLRADVRCRVAAMSGAGPTCFGLYDDDDAARAVAGDLAVRHPDWWVIAATLR